MKSAVTLSLVPEARGGPFVFWEDIGAACRTSAELGFDGIEVFPPSADVLESSGLRSILAEYRLALAAVGTGAGWVKHQLTLTSGDADVRQRAIRFAGEIIDAAGRLGAPAIIGSMQGRWGGDVQRDAALAFLRESLDQLGERAARFGVPLIYEPLNRYETNLCNTMTQGRQLLEQLSTSNVRLLADLFHMNMEETNLPDAIRAGGRLIGHVHWADSNRRPAGYGHTDFAPIAVAVGEIGSIWISAEALPYPDSDSAARATIASFNRYFRG